MPNADPVSTARVLQVRHSAAWPGADKHPRHRRRLGVTCSTNTFIRWTRLLRIRFPRLVRQGGPLLAPRQSPGAGSDARPSAHPGVLLPGLHGVSVGWWLFKRKPRSYFNTVVDAGFLYGLDGTRLLAFRLVPVIFGGPYYRMGTGCSRQGWSTTWTMTLLLAAPAHRY